MKTQQDKTKQNRLVLPMGQTVFLPQTAMGVSYIDKVRTKVYIDNLQRQREQGLVCLRGFYEIDLEYHGLEGQRLYKHRVMLPLRVELPDDWLLPLEYEADELHAVISQPMLRILSPYVLEFSGQLVVEYVGDLMHRFDDDGHDCDDDDWDDGHDHDCDDDDWDDDDCRGRRDYHLPYIYQAEAAEAESQPEQLPAGGTDSKYHLPVWNGQPESAVEAVAEASASEVAADETPNEIAAEETAAEAQAEPVLAEVVAEPPTAAAEVPQPAARTVAAEGELPAFDGAERSKMRSLLTSAAIARLQAKGEKLVGSAAEDNLPDKPVSVVQENSGEPVQEVILISEEKDMPRLAAAADELAARAASVAVQNEAEPVEAESQAEIAAVESGAQAEAVSVAAMAGDEPDLAEAAEQKEISPVEAANELAEAVSAAAEASEDAVAAAAVATQPAGAAGAASLVNANGVRLRVGLREPDRISPATSGSTGKGGFRLKYYVVKPGDDPMSIALQHNVPLESLRAANQALAGDLNVGMVLRIPS